MIYYNPDVLNKFRIGDIFKREHTEMLGWIVGLALSGGSEVVFQVKYANAPDEVCLVHPSNINPLSLM